MEYYLKNIDNGSILENLKNSIVKEELKVYYQPRINILNESIIGMEALLRWNNISPSKVIALAEQSNLIYEISDYVTKIACEETSLWNLKKGKNLILSVNISAKQFENRNFIFWLTDILYETGFNPEQLEIEITENIAVKNIERTVEILRELKALGIKIALDDFGTGYSSFKYLNKLPIDIIKIDKSFVDGITLDKKQEIIVSKIIEMAHCLNLKVIAEGVELFEQFQMLKKLNCDEAQGFYFSKPLRSSEFEKLII